jgi:non-specific serine/threonine protein kinase
VSSRAVQQASAKGGERDVVYADFSRTEDDRGFPDTICAAAGITERSEADASLEVAGQLAERNVLLVLDNCEHVVSSAARLAETVLRRCPNVAILATTREPLGIPGETVFRVPVLPVPARGVALGIEETLRYDAVRLFVERGKAAQPSFSPGAQDAEHLGEIARRLDGLPLALELAAPRLKMMTLKQIEEGLSDPFRTLTSGNRTAPPRQQTLQAMIACGYELLSPAEKRLAQRLSVLAGAWTLDVATAFGARSGLNKADVFEYAAALVEKSFIVADGLEGPPRYRMLELTRIFMRAQLEKSGDLAAAGDQHAATFADLLDGLRARTRGQLVAAVWPDYANYEAALRWTLEATGDRATGFRLTRGLARFWNDVGSFAAARYWIALARPFGPADDSAGHALLALEAARAHAALGETDRASALAQEAREAYAAAGDSNACARANRVLAELARTRGATADAERLLREISGDARVEADERVEALGVLAAIAGGDRGNTIEADRILASALGLVDPRNPEVRAAIAGTLLRWAENAFANNDFEAARERAAIALSANESLRNPAGMSAACILSGFAALALDNEGAAAESLRHGLSLAAGGALEAPAATALEGYARIAFLRNDAGTAAALAGFARESRTRTGTRRPQALDIAVTAWTAETSEKLGQAEFERAAAQGRKMLLDDAVRAAHLSSKASRPG